MFSVFKKGSKTELQTGGLEEVSQTKRLFFKGVATAGVALAAVSSLMPSKKKENSNLQSAYEQDVLPGDKILQQNGFEEISKEETETMVQMFIDDYQHKRQV